MKVEVVKNVIIRASLKQVGDILDVSDKDLLKYGDFLKQVSDEGDKELVGIQEGHGKSQSKPTKKK